MPAENIPILDLFDYDAQIRRGADALNNGQLIVLPTETVYGIAGRLDLPAGRARLTALRGGAEHRPWTLHLPDPRDAAKYLPLLNDFATRLMEKLWPGPVGLVFDVPADRRRSAAADAKLAESDLYHPDGTITLRCPDHPVAADIIAAAAGPVAMTTAGLTTGGSAHTPGEFAPDLADKVDLIFSAGPTRYTKSSTLIKVERDRFQVLRPGVYDERIIERLLRTTILFVCSGNTCRSAMAEALARQMIASKLSVSAEDLDKKGISVISAGAFAMPGSRATPAAVNAVKTFGADLSRHRSRPLTIELIHQADIIYTMSRGHLQAVTSLVPSSAAKASMLDPSSDIEDPIGGDPPLYQNLARELQDLIDRRLREKVLK